MIDVLQLAESFHAVNVLQYQLKLGTRAPHAAWVYLADMAMYVWADVQDRAVVHIALDNKKWAINFQYFRRKVLPHNQAHGLYRTGVETAGVHHSCDDFLSKKPSIEVALAHIAWVSRTPAKLNRWLLPWYRT